MVTEFAAGVQVAMAPPRNCATTIFLEPFLESGAPDLVAVTWHVPTAKALWHLAANLRVDSLRVLHFLATSPERSDNLLEDVFGRRRSKALIGELLEQGAVRRHRGTWTVKGRDRVFAVRKIVAIEAKLSDAARLLQQASNNRWFASESYALFRRRPTEPSMQSARRLGVGVWVHGDEQPSLKAKNSAEQPVSYASWLFNTWIAHHARLLDGGARDR
ncbi:MAG: hypothetical protein IT383_10555 [Deltaproteobacteria bacterium]|nr:hypothetical protein [Deltaproteobacteria bacterium]